MSYYCGQCGKLCDAKWKLVDDERGEDYEPFSNCCDFLVYSDLKNEVIAEPK